jgi:hypothetical protein
MPSEIFLLQQGAALESSIPVPEANRRAGMLAEEGNLIFACSTLTIVYLSIICNRLGMERMALGMDEDMVLGMAVGMAVGKDRSMDRSMDHSSSLLIRTLLKRMQRVNLVISYSLLRLLRNLLL